METSNLVDQKLRRVRQLVAERPALFSRQGAVVASWRTVGGRRLGPYFALRYREDQRQRSVYLGGSAALATAVRQLLARRQQPRRQRLTLNRLRASIKAAMRRHVPTWRRQLVDVGLASKGFEIRRWKSFRGQTAPHEAASHSRRL